MLPPEFLVLIEDESEEFICRALDPEVDRFSCGMGSLEQKTVFGVRMGERAASGESVDRASIRIKDQSFSTDVDEKRDLFSREPFRDCPCDMEPCAFPVFAPFFSLGDWFVSQIETVLEFHWIFACRVFTAESGTVGIDLVFDPSAKNVCPALIKFKFLRKHAENPFCWLKYNRLH